MTKYCNECGLERQFCSCQVTVIEKIVIGYKKFLPVISESLDKIGSFQVINFDNIDEAINFIKKNTKDIAFIIVDVDNLNNVNNNLVKKFIEEKIGQEMVFLRFMANKQRELSLGKLDLTKNCKSCGARILKGEKTCNCCGNVLL